MPDLATADRPSQPRTNIAGESIGVVGALISDDGERRVYEVELDPACARQQRMKLMGRGRTPYVAFDTQDRQIASGWL